jgi:hypothetical protein
VLLPPLPLQSKQRRKLLLQKETKRKMKVIW